jgi:hypothetical protein
MPTRDPHTRNARRGGWLVKCAVPWVCALTVSVMVAAVANVALIDAFTANDAVTADSATSDIANLDQADTAVRCDTSTGRMLYVTALNECLPAQW